MLAWKCVDFDTKSYFVVWNMLYYVWCSHVEYALPGTVHIGVINTRHFVINWMSLNRQKFYLWRYHTRRMKIKRKKSCQYQQNNYQQGRIVDHDTTCVIHCVDDELISKEILMTVLMPTTMKSVSAQYKKKWYHSSKPVSHNLFRIIIK